MSKKCFKAKVIVVEIPEFDCEVRGTGCEVFSLLIVGNVVNGI